MRDCSHKNHVKCTGYGLQTDQAEGRQDSVILGLAQIRSKLNSDNKSHCSAENAVEFTEVSVKFLRSSAVAVNEKKIRVSKK